MTRYAKPKQKVLREHMFKFYLENKSRKKNFTFLYFKAQTISKSTIYRIIQRTENRLGLKRKIGSERKPKKKDFNGK